MAMLFSDDEVLTLGANSGTDVTNKVYEKHTVSGSVVTFSDGADRVPLKKCEVTLPASLDGYSEVDVVHTGANLVALNVSPQQAKRDFGVTVNTQTADILNITSTGIAYSCERLFYSFKKGTYSIKFLATSSDSFTPVISIYRTNGTGVKFNIQPNTLTTFTLAGDADIDIRLFVSGSGDTTVRTVEFSYLQIEVGSTVSAYSQYNSTIYTASLGRTIYGGTVDVVKGTGSETHGNVKVSDLTWTKQTASGRDFFISQVSNMKTGTPKEIASVLPYGGEITVAAMADKSLATWTNSLRIYDTDITTVSELLEAYGNDGISYPLATPETFTFTPITPTPETALGTNNFWAEQGTNIELTYYSEREVINNYSVTATQLTAIADAIREKKGTTNPILFEDFPDEIRTIETGGGGGEDVVTWVYTASGSADNHYYTAQEDGLYLAVAVRNQNTGCSISLPDGGDVVLTSTLLSPRFQMKVVRLTAGQRITLYIYNSTHVRGGWIFKLNVTPSAIAYTRAVDQYGAYNIVNQGTSNTVLSILATAWGNSYGGWDPTMKCFALSPLNSTANIRIMYGIDMTMPSIPYGGPSTCQWILNIQED